MTIEAEHPELRLKMARKHKVRPSLYPGDIVKKKRVPGNSRDDRLFVILKVSLHRDYFYDDNGSHDGEDQLVIREYKKRNSPVRFVMRKNVWFTGKRL